MENNKLKIVQELKEKLFEIERWPHYQIMFDGLDKVIKGINKEDNLALLERCYIYDNYSIFSSLFELGKLDILNFIPPNSNHKSRQSYQFDRLENLPETKKRIKKANINVDVVNLKKTIASRNKYDYIFIPNVLHHYPNPFELFDICKSGLKDKGYLYIFDATLRENHQKPDDFIRFTPDGIVYTLKNIGFEISDLSLSKSPLEALIYTIDQVIQYDLPQDLVADINKLNKTIKTKYKSTLNENFNNKVRKYTSFPVAYSLLAQLK